MRKLFVSYARENKRDVDQLVEHLGMMGYDTWVDESLRGGQDWWEEILQRIADSDAFIAIISHAALNSTACRREFDWAEALRKPVVPVAIEPAPTALPSRIVRRQIIDYSQPAERALAALKLQGGLATLPPASPLLSPLPEPPAAPLSYLTNLVDLINQASTLDYEQQHQILRQLEPALRSTDPEERRGGRDILEQLSSRREIFADVDRTINRLRGLAAEPAPVYDSATEPKAFQDWSYFKERGNTSLAWDTFPLDASERVMGMVAVGKEAVGLNKSLRLLSGVVEFEYRVASFDEIVNQVYFAVIPMEETGIGRKGLIELGADVQGDPRNPTSMYRLRYFVPRGHYRDHAWHSVPGGMPFDFTNHDRAFYSIFAPRINEGLERRGDAEVHVRNVKVWATSR